MGVVDIPAEAGDVVDVDAATVTPAFVAKSGMARQLVPTGAKSVRPTISGRQLLQGNHPIRLFGTTLSAGGCLPGGVASWPARQVQEVKEHGFNCVRFHHFDQPTGSPAGIITDKNVEWWALDTTAKGYLANLMNLYANAGFYYHFDTTSLLGGPAMPFGGDAVIAIWQEFFPASDPDTTVASGATNATQAFTDASDFVAGMDVYFHNQDVTRRIQSIASNNVTFTASVTTDTDERVTIGIGGQNDVSGLPYIIPFSEVATTQLQSYINALEALTVGSYNPFSHPNCVRVNVLNENIIESAPAGTFKLILDEFLGYTFNVSTSAHRTDYANQVIAWFADMKAWFGTNIASHPPLAHASEFGHEYEEFDAIREDPNNEWLLDHTYAPVTVGTGVTLRAEPPQEVYAALPYIDSNFPAGIEAKYGAKPTSFEETGAGDGNGKGAMWQVPILVAIAGATLDMTECHLFGWDDGGYTPSDVGSLSGLNHARDFLTRAACLPAQNIFLRRDLETLARQTSTNTYFQNYAAGTSYCAVDTERTILLMGYEAATYEFQSGQEITIDEIVFGSQHGAFVTSMDIPGKPIWYANSGIIGHLTSITRRERQYNDDYTVVNSAGTGSPGTCIGHGTVTITFRHEFAANLTIYRLDNARVRGNAITPTIDGNMVTVVLEIDATNSTFLYEWEVSGVVRR